MMTKEMAISLTYGTTIYHVRLRNRDGSAIRARVNGACKMWKTRPDDFRVPMKHGLRDCFYLEPHNAGDWCLLDPTEEARREAFRAKRKAQLRKRFCLSDDCPDYALRDRCLKEGMSDVVADVFTR